MAVVAVGREGVVWWEGEGKKGWILSSSVCLSPRMESLPKGGGGGVPTSLLALSRFFSSLLIRATYDA